MRYQPLDPEVEITRVSDVLPDLVKRIDHAAIDAIEKAVETLAVDRVDVQDAYEGFHGHAELWKQLLAVLENEQESLEAFQDVFTEFTNAYLSETTENGRVAQLTRFATELGKHALATKHERRDIHTLTDFEAIQYRYQRIENRIEARLRTCVIALGRLARHIARNIDADAASKFIQLRRIDVLFELVRESNFPHLRWLALESLSPFLMVVIASEPDRVPVSWIRLLTSINATEQESWLEIAVVEVLANDRDEGITILADRLKPRDYRDDWHTRAHCVELLFERYPDVAWEVLESLIPTEDRDGVLIAIARNAIRSESSVELFTALNEKSGDAFERLRANVANEILQHIAAGHDALIPIAESMLRHEPSTVVMEVFLHRIASVVPSCIDREAVETIVTERLASEANPSVSNAFVRILTRIQKEEDQTFANLKPGESVTVGFTRPELRRKMIHAADEGYGLYAKPKGEAFVVTRGESFRPKPWRVLHEIRRPAPDKRQGHDHLRGRVFAGTIRAHPFDLAEVTPTTVPGERKLIRREESSGYYLPSVDDVLDAQSSGTPIEVLSPHGVVVIYAPDSRIERLKNYVRMTWNYRLLDQQRFASLSGDDAAQRARFTTILKEEYGTTLELESHDWEVPKHAAETLLPQASLAITPALWFGELSERLSRTVQISDLAIALVATFVLFLGRLAVAKYRIESWRRQIPLSVGGWGTRGKSGTERLKAGMFHGLGYDVFVKTTGCEAMFIHAPRNVKAREIFIYRPYDKATIWEQRDLLAMGANVQTDVFLWECMALNPRYVNLLQSHWMQDDIVTLTNAYPDHEDIQGPTGIDVAETISQFIPPKTRVLTTEREMFPVFEAAARRKNAQMVRVAQIEEHLFSNDILGRFPYQEHPRNIALVKRLAIELGVEPEFATFKMADNVVADLGVLKVYPEVNVYGRRLSFINGCSANERAGFMANWTRLRMADITPEQQPKRRVYTVVNNRGDRIARSKVFADILANDIAVDGHFLIGTNLAGLKNYLSESIDTYLANYVIIEDGESVEVGVKRLIDLLARVRMHPSENGYLEDQLQTMSAAVAAPFQIIGKELERLEADVAVSNYADTLKSIRENDVLKQIELEFSEASVGFDEFQPALEPFERATPEDVVAHWTRMVADVFIARSLIEELRTAVDENKTQAFTQRVQAIWKEKFLSRVRAIENSKATGDQIIVEIAKSVEPGCHIKLMGTQNIKGTGLDFVYRWVYLQETVNDLARLEKLSDSQLRDALVSFATFESQGLMEVLEALRALQVYTSKHTISPANKQFLDAAVSHLRALLERKSKASLSAESAGGQSRREKMIRELERWLDPFDAVYRRTRADYLKRRFSHQQVSHAKMADEMKTLTYRQKGGWL